VNILFTVDIIADIAEAVNTHFALNAHFPSQIIQPIDAPARFAAGLDTAHQDAYTLFADPENSRGGDVRVRVDMHIHTRYSPDSLTTPQDVVRWARRRRLGAIAITDHNTIRGALNVARLSPIPVIVGEEITTQEGEIIGLFLHQEIAPGRTARETVQEIRRQGGLVYVPHPIDRARKSALGLDALLEIIDDVDILEVLNARVTFSIDNDQVRSLARTRGLLQGAGSDAHQGFEIGGVYVEMTPFEGPGEFMSSLAHGQVHGRTASPLVHIGSTCARVAKNLRALLVPPHPS